MAAFPFSSGIQIKQLLKPQKVINSLRTSAIQIFINQ